MTLGPEECEARAPKAIVDGSPLPPAFCNRFVGHGGWHESSAGLKWVDMALEFEDFNPNREAAWVAYYTDFSGIAVFAGELECLRYAIKHAMAVARVPLGVDVREAVNTSTRNHEKGGQS